MAMARLQKSPAFLKKTLFFFASSSSFCSNDQSHQTKFEAYSSLLQKGEMIIVGCHCVFVSFGFANKLVKGMDDIALHFYDYVGYRYMTSTIVIGGAYSIWQTVTSVIRYNKGYEGNPMLDYYGDKVMSLTLATGSVAGFVMTGELQREFKGIHDKFFTMGYAADGFVFLGFICASILTEIASYALPRRF